MEIINILFFKNCFCGYEFPKLKHSAITTLATFLQTNQLKHTVIDENDQQYL